VDIIKAWLNAHNVTTKSILAFIVSGSCIISTVPQAKDFVLLTFQRHPYVGTWVMAAAGLITLLMSPHSDAGALAHANAIKAKPDAPTAADVSAATTK
jgi:hypothetical protein